MNFSLTPRRSPVRINLFQSLSSKIPFNECHHSHEQRRISNVSAQALQVGNQILLQSGLNVDVNKMKAVKENQGK